MPGLATAPASCRHPLEMAPALLSCSPAGTLMSVAMPGTVGYSSCMQGYLPLCHIRERSLQGTGHLQDI